MCTFLMLTTTRLFCFLKVVPFNQDLQGSWWEKFIVHFVIVIQQLEPNCWGQGLVERFSEDPSVV